MSAVEDLPTYAEQYATAVADGSLRVNLERRTPADLIMAAGMAKGYAGQDVALGTSLYRLRCEFDGVKASQHIRGALSLTDQLFVLMELKTLSSTKALLGAKAIVWATQQRFMKPDQDALRIAGRALDVWLSPICPKCEGVGKRGEVGKPMALCRTCGGTGHRKSTIGEDDADRKFGQFLLAEMDRQVSMVDEALRVKLGGRMSL